MTNPSRSGRGFTLVELLVVIAVVAILIGVLLPALAGARKQAQSMVVANNLRSIAQAVVAYTAQNEVYPPHYVYGSKETGPYWRESMQQETNPVPANGYVHWSYSLFGEEELEESEAFQSPLVPKGGAPRTNPGEKIEDWEPGQTNDLGGGAGSEFPKDRQVARVAFAGNAAIFPRNKFAQSTNRKSRLVNPGWIDRASDTILATEFLYADDWKSLRSGTDGVIKSHRPITPFLGRSSGTDVYAEPDRGTQARFTYPRTNDIKPVDQLGFNEIDSGVSVLNAVARHHTGGDSEYGGSTYFVFVDGHTDRKTLIETVKNRNWGEKFYSITGRGTDVVSPVR